MHDYISYKNEKLWLGSTSRFEDLSEKLLSIAHQKSLESHSNLVQFIEKIGYYTSGFVDKWLNSKKEVAQLAELLELAINEWIQEGYYDYYNYEENGKIQNHVISEYRHLAKRLSEIATHEWSDDNLFINRANTLNYIAPTLLYFACQKNLSSSSHLMKYLQKLYTGKAKDIEIYSKEELTQFIELAELSMQKLIQKGYFNQYEIVRNGETFNYLKYNYLAYIDRLKEVANDWSNAVSDEWKKGKIIRTEETVHNNQSISEDTHKRKSIIKDLLRFIIYLSLVIIVITSIIWALVFITNFIQKF